jgi:hypothetical protein
MTDQTRQKERQDVRIEEVEQPKKKLKENLPGVFPQKKLHQLLGFPRP